MENTTFPCFENMESSLFHVFFKYHELSYMKETVENSLFHVFSRSPYFWRYSPENLREHGKTHFSMFSIRMKVGLLKLQISKTVILRYILLIQGLYFA